MRFSTLLTAGLFLAVTSVFGAPFEPRRADDVLARELKDDIRMGPNVPADHHASAHAAVLAHHANLPDTDPAKGAHSAKVFSNGWHETPGGDQQHHLTVNFYKQGAQKGKNSLGVHHVYHTRRSLDFDARELKDDIRMGPNVPADHVASAHAAVVAHHASLPADHPAKGAQSAKVFSNG